MGGVPAGGLDSTLDPAVSGATVASLVLTLVALAALAALVRRLRDVQREAAQGAKHHASQAAALAELAALLAASPAAAFRWRLADGSETFSPGLLANLRFEGPPRFADLLEQLVPEDTTFLAAAVEALRASGTAFALTLDRKGGGAVDAIGRRVCDAGGQ